MKKLILGLASAFCLLVVFFFKYFNFASKTITTILAELSISLSPLTLHLILPVGISFYTFQTLSYVIDVYWGKMKAEKNFGIYAVYISFFPQLVAGPIERSSNLLPQIKAEHHFNSDKALYGAKLMLWGYFKKIVLADNLAKYVDLVYGNLNQYKGFNLVLAVFFFTIQIYCDFSGYSDIAIGTAKLLDIDLMTNFKSPYLSASVKEFWRRWHISLSTWFRDYVYIPLGGNHCSKIRCGMNLLVTFLVSGLWHGANWTFVVWGGIHGLAQILENACSFLIKRIRKNKAGHLFCILLVFIFCNIAWIFFRAETFSDAFYVLKHIVEDWLYNNRVDYFSNLMIAPSTLLLFAMYFIILLIYDYIDYTGNTILWLNEKSSVFRWSFYILVGLMIVFCSQKGVAAEFIYFQF